MDALIQSLGGLLLKAIPTVVLLIIVHFYLKFMLFRPLQKVLTKRREATEGARGAAEKIRQLAREKGSAYELAVKEARSDIYREQEEMRRQWLDDSTKRIEDARQKAHSMLQEAGQEIDADIAAAREDLSSRSQMLALQIVENLVGRTR